jgi:AraC-like DNA-binding protein
MFQLHATSKILKPYVRFYFQMQVKEMTPFRSLLTATMDSALVFHFGSSNSYINYEFPNSPDKHYTFHKNHAWLGGMHNQPLICDLGTDVSVIVAILTPLGIQHLLRDNASTMLNQGLSFETLGIHKKFSELIEKLEGVNNIEEALQLIELRLLNYYNCIDIPFSIKNMSPITNYIWQRNGIVKVKDLEHKFHISRRWLEKQFADQIGLSPKEYARIVRFKSFLASAINTPSVSLATQTENFGYYDQSHLTRDFHAFAGQTPVKYFQNHISEINNYFYAGFE